MRSVANCGNPRDIRTELLMPTTQISRFWAFLPGVCLIAMGLTVLETVANP